jgi:hypothetical protein
VSGLGSTRSEIMAGCVTGRYGGRPTTLGFSPAVYNDHGFRFRGVSVSEGSEVKGAESSHLADQGNRTEGRRST